MSTKRVGNRVVNDLTRVILFTVKRGASSTVDVVDLLGASYGDAVVRNRMYSLKRHGYLKAEQEHGITITPKGTAALENLKLRTIRIPKVWDKKWRLVIYDIPETRRTARDNIRQLLKSLGFKQLQISCWAHPLPCLQQFHDIRQAYGIQEHLFLFEVNDSNEFDTLRTQFAKLYSQLTLD